MTRAGRAVSGARISDVLTHARSTSASERAMGSSPSHRGPFALFASTRVYPAQSLLWEGLHRGEPNCARGTVRHKSFTALFLECCASAVLMFTFLSASSGSP